MLAGVWDIEVIGSARTSRITLCLDRDHLGNRRRASDGPWVANMARRGATGDSYEHAAVRRINVADDGSIAIEYGQFGYCNCKRERIEAKQTGTRGLLKGTWSYEGESGKATWRRRPPSRIDSVRISRAYIEEDGGYTPDSYRYGERPGRIQRKHPITCGAGRSRSNCDRVFVRIIGEGFAGTNDIWCVNEQSQLDETFELSGIRWLCSDYSTADDGWYECGMKETPGDQVIGLEATIYLWDGVEPGMKELRVNSQSVLIDLVIDGYPIPKAIADFPDDGIVPDIGALDSQKTPPPTDQCKCSAITLGRVTTQLFTGMDSSLFRRIGIGRRPTRKYNRTVHYMIDKTVFPPVRDHIYVQPIEHEDLMCFYFTFPKESAAWVLEGQWGPCKTEVVIDYPHSKTEGGIASGKWQLYSQKGALYGRSNCGNFICLQVRKHTRIPPGEGKVTWYVDGRKCSTVPFTVR